MAITVKSTGDYKNTIAYLKKISSGRIFDQLDAYGRMGQAALESATPVRTDLTAHSWEYRVTKDGFGPVIEWYNTNIDDEGTPVAILIQYGHGTGTGGYVEGRDYINPAIQPVFDTIVEDIWKELIVS